MFKNHQLVQDYVKKHDEPILRHLKDVRGHLHPQGFGMTLEFEFDEGAKEWFEESILRKSYHMVDEDVLERTECTEIHWVEGKNITKKNVTKKQKNKWTGEVREVKKLEDWDSFFKFFKPQNLPVPEEMEKMTKEVRDELGEKLDEDFDLGNDFLNEIIPEALETYLKLNDTGFSDLDSDSRKNVSDGENEAT